MFSQELQNFNKLYYYITFIVLALLSDFEKCRAFKLESRQILMTI
jgi:hypothetical protein